MLTKNFKKLGILNKKEAAVYLTILELGETTIQRIADKSELKRTTIYNVIDSLKRKSLVGIVKRKEKSFYYAEDPRRIGESLEDKKREYQKMLPELLSIANFMDKKPKIKFFEGIIGIKEVYKDTLSYPNQEILAWVSSEAKDYFDIDWLWDFYVSKRIEKKIWQRSITVEDEYMRYVATFDEKHLRRTKFVPSEEFPLEVEINLYGKRNIGFMAFREQIGLIIESEKIFNTLKSVFEINWKKNLATP